MDQDQLYIVDGHRIYIHARDDFRLIRMFGKAGEEEDAFRPRSGNNMRLFVNVQSEDMIICSERRAGVFTKNGEFIKDLNSPYMVDYVVPLGKKYIGSAYYIHVGTGKSTQHILLGDQKLNFSNEIAGSHLGGGSAKGFGGPDRKIHIDLIPLYFGFKIYKGKIFVGQAHKRFFFEVFDSKGEKLYEIKRDEPKHPVTDAYKKERLEKIKNLSLYKRHKDSLVIDEAEHFPAFRNFAVTGDKIFVITFKELEEKQEILVLDLKGQLLDREFVPKAEVFLIEGNRFYYLDKHEDGEWELKVEKMLTEGQETVVKIDEDERTSLHRTAIRVKKGLAYHLFQNIFKLNKKDRYGFTALHYAALKGNVDLAHLLVNFGAYVNSRNNYGHTPLHLAAKKDFASIAELLISRGADFFAEDRDGRTPASLAAEEGYRKTSGNLMPLHLYTQKGDLEKIKSLLDRDPDLLITKDYRGRTALHIAKKYGKEEIAAFLISKGADSNAEDKFGYIPDDISLDNFRKRTGFDLLDPSAAEEIDFYSNEKTTKYSFINVCLVYDGKIVFSRSYGSGRLDSENAWGSVSKPVTAMIIMHLVSEGIIQSIDDPIWKYSKRYENCMPEEYADTPVTLRHLLIHKSGVPHNNEPTWKNGKLNLKFRPGTKDRYSTPGYGILGHVIEGATHKSYSEAVKDFIGKPVNALSFHAEKHFRAPGARVHSTVEDMALFSLGVMNFIYVPEEMFYNEMIQYTNGPTGIGWGILNKDSSDLIVSHGGSNGYPQAYLLIKPRKKISISILARSKDRNIFELDDLAFQLLSVLDGLSGSADNRRLK
jgi:ankyrin repeat protein/CubicO group peptidase (beta-lactamase class C family)